MWHKGKIKKTDSVVAEYQSRHCTFRVLNAYKQEGNIFSLVCTDCSALSSVQIPINSTGLLTHIQDWTASPFLLWRPVIQPSSFSSHLSPHSKHFFDISPFHPSGLCLGFPLCLWTVFDLWCRFALSTANYPSWAFSPLLHGTQELSPSEELFKLWDLKV